MSELKTQPTPYPGVNTLVLQLFSGAKKVLGAHFVRMYLQGSLAGGDFNLERSDIESLIDPIHPDDLRRAARATLREWWAPILIDPTLLRSREYQAFAVLTMCRALYTIAHGDVVPKPVAARWSQRLLGRNWEGLIERALAWPRGPQPDEMEATKDFIQYTLDRPRKINSLKTLD